MPDWFGEGVTQDCIHNEEKCSETLSALSAQRTGMWWIERVLISLAAILFCLTVTAQLWIYLN